MNKNDLLKVIAEKGYDIGFGAKKHFATYDVIEKAPGWISFISIAVGILGLIFSCLATKYISAVIIIVGISSLYINFYDHKKEEYNKAGQDMTRILSKLKALYYNVKDSPEGTDLSHYEDTLDSLESQFYAMGLSKQILASNWYAHYKFFWEQQIQWIDEQLKFKIFRDKIPLSLMIFVVLIAVIFAFLTFMNLPFCR